MKSLVFFTDYHNTFNSNYTQYFTDLVHVIIKESLCRPELPFDLDLTASGKIINSFGNDALFTDNSIYTYILFKYTILHNQLCDVPKSRFKAPEEQSLSYFML